MSEPPEIDPMNPLAWPEDKANELAELHYAAIGRVAAEWAALETTIDTMSLRIAQIQPKIGVCLTAQISGSARKLDAYIALARLFGVVKLLSKLNEFAKDTQSLAERRNRVVHDPWIGSVNPHRLEATARRVLRLEFISVPTEQVKKLSQEITHHCVRFEKLAKEVEAEARTSRQKPLPKPKA
jgi:hypothetical protein